jgi:hypothetical protein
MFDMTLTALNYNLPLIIFHIPKISFTCLGIAEESVYSVRLLLRQRFSTTQGNER